MGIKSRFIYCIIYRSYNLNINDPIQLCLELISTLCPGALFSVSIPTSTNIDDIIQINLKTDTSSLVQQQKENKNNYYSANYKVAKLFENYQMRDLYNRKKKLDYWTERIHIV